jgi:hypothetical protein
MKHIPEMYRPFNYSTNKNHNSNTQPVRARNENEKLLPDEVPEEDSNCCSSCTIF